jgi:hypothetical protein
MLWFVDPFEGNDHEISNYTTAVTRQQLLNSNRGTVFSVRSVPRCYKLLQLVRSESVCEFVRGLLRFSCCEKLVSEAGDALGTQRKGNVRS